MKSIALIALLPVLAGAQTFFKDVAPLIPREGAISDDRNSMPDAIMYDAGNQRLSLGSGFVDRVSPRVWSYEVSGKNVLRQWFSYRKANRDRPLIGDRRPPSKLGDVQPDHWLAEYTSDLIDLLNVLAMLIEVESAQASLLDRICSGPLFSAAEVTDVAPTGSQGRKTGLRPSVAKHQTSFDELEQPI